MKENTQRVGSTTHKPEFEEFDVFKFGKLQYVKQTLENCTLKFSSLESYNDPFESSFRYLYHYNSHVARDNMFADLFKNKGKMTNKHPEQIRQIVDLELEKKMVSCFSTSPSEPLMWSHYSDDHRGICLCFNKYKIFNKLNFTFSEVRYTNKFPDLNFFEGSTSIEHLKPQINNILFTKSDNWAYEKEYRFYSDSDKDIHNFIPDSLQGLILGSRVNEDDGKTIRKLVETYNDKHSTQVKIMYAIPSKTTYEMLITYNSNVGAPTTFPVYDSSSPNL